MEQDFDKRHWEGNCCSRPTCKKKVCECGLKFVSVPAALTAEMAPKNGAYSNAIVQYEATGEVWIYSSEGIPVKVRGANA